MATIYGELSLAVSKKTGLKFNEATTLFDETNIKGIKNIVVETMDGKLHSFKVEDHFVKWKDEGEEE